MKKMRRDSSMLKEYDFSNGVRGKYIPALKKGSNVVVIEPDLTKYFPDQASVNDSLRSLAAIFERRKKSSARA